MAGNLSIKSAIRTCKADVSNAEKMFSDRFLNPSQMVCPVWSGHDLTGRSVCADSFMTKSPGCNSAEDRISIENKVSRPAYFELITLDDTLSADLYGTTKWDMIKAKKDLQNNGYTGVQYGSVIRCKK